MAATRPLVSIIPNAFISTSVQTRTGTYSTEAKAGLDAAVDMIENVCHFVSANDTDDVCYYAHCISRTGSYISTSVQTRTGTYSTGRSATDSTAAANASQADLQADWLPVSRAPPGRAAPAGRRAPAGAPR